MPSRLGGQFSDLLGTFNWTTMLDSLVNTAKDQLTSSLTLILPRLAAKFVPGVGILTSIYDGIKFLIDNAANLGAIFTTFVNSLGDLAASVTDSTKLTSFTSAIVNIVQNQGLDLVLNFATSQLGLGNLRQSVKNVVSFIPNQVDALMRRIISGIATRITAALPGGGSTGL